MAGVILLDPPFEGKLKLTGEPVVIIALAWPQALYVDAEGNLNTSDVLEFALDWRYDYKNRKWIDVGGQVDDGQT